MTAKQNEDRCMENWCFEEYENIMHHSNSASSLLEKDEFEVVPQVKKNAFEIIPQQKVRCLDEDQLEIHENHFLFGGENAYDSDSEIEILTRSTADVVNTTFNKFYSEILEDEIFSKAGDHLDLAKTFGNIIESKRTADEISAEKVDDVIEDMPNNSEKELHSEPVMQPDDVSGCEVTTSSKWDEEIGEIDHGTEWHDQSDSIEIVFSNQAKDGSLIETTPASLYSRYDAQICEADDKDLSGLKELFDKSITSHNKDDDNGSDDNGSDDNDSDEDSDYDTFDENESDVTHNELISMKTPTLTIILCSCVLLGVLVGTGCGSLFVYIDTPNKSSPVVINKNEISPTDIELLLTSRNVKINISQIWPSSNSKKDVKVLLQALWLLQKENNALKATLEDYKEHYHFQKQMSLYWKKEVKKDLNKQETPSKIYDGYMNVESDREAVDTIIQDVVNFSMYSPAVRNHSEIIKKLERTLAVEKERIQYWRKKFLALNVSRRCEANLNLSTCLDLFANVLPDFNLSTKLENLSKPVAKLSNQLQSVWNKFKNGWKKNEEKDNQKINDINKLKMFFNSIISKKYDVQVNDHKFCPEDVFRKFQERWRRTDLKIAYPKPVPEQNIQSTKTYPSSAEIKKNNGKKSLSHAQYFSNADSSKGENSTINSNDEIVKVIGLGNDVLVEVMQPDYQKLENLIQNSCLQNKDCKSTSIIDDQQSRKCIAYQKTKDLYVEFLNEKVRTVKREPQTNHQGVGESLYDDTSKKSGNQVVNHYSCSGDTYIEILNEGNTEMKSLLFEECKKQKMEFKGIKHKVVNGSNNCAAFQHVTDYYFKEISGKLQIVQKDSNTDQNKLLGKNIPKMKNSKKRTTANMYSCNKSDYVEVMDDDFLEAILVFYSQCKVNGDCNSYPSDTDNPIGIEKCQTYERLGNLYIEIITGKTRKIARCTKAKYGENAEQNPSAEKYEEESLVDTTKSSNEKDKYKKIKAADRWLDNIDFDFDFLDDFNVDENFSVDDGQNWYKKQLVERQFRFDIEKWKMKGEFKNIVKDLENKIERLWKKEQELKASLNVAKDRLLQEKKQHKGNLKKLKQYVKKQKSKLDEWKFKEKLQLKSNINGLKEQVKKERNTYKRKLQKANKMFKSKLEEAYKKLKDQKKVSAYNNNKSFANAASYRTKYKLLHLELQTIRSKYEKLLNESGKQPKVKVDQLDLNDDEDDNISQAEWHLPSVYCPNGDHCQESTPSHAPKEYNENEKPQTIFDIARSYQDVSLTPLPLKPIPPKTFVFPSVEFKSKTKTRSSKINDLFVTKTYEAPTRPTPPKRIFQSEIDEAPLKPSPPKSLLQPESVSSEMDQIAAPLSWYLYWGKYRETYNIYKDLGDHLPLNWYIAWMQSREDFRRENDHETPTEELNWYLKLMKEREKQRNIDIPMSWYFKWIKGRQNSFKGGYNSDDDD